MDMDTTAQLEHRMLLRRRVRSDLPLLRRFGRALTGDQRLADTAALQLVEELLEPGSEGLRSRLLRPQLYRRLREILGAYLGVNKQRVGFIGNTPLMRQAHLLTMIEGFSRLDTATILAITPAQVETLLAEAGHTIGKQGAARLLIIEDEPLISMQLEQLVKELGHCVIGTATTLQQAVALAASSGANLILSDVQLADGSSGIDAVNHMRCTTDAGVIFITAYPDRLQTGERPEPNFLVTKPFDPDAVKATISQALFLSMYPATGHCLSGETDR